MFRRSEKHRRFSRVSCASRDASRTFRAAGTRAFSPKLNFTPGAELREGDEDDDVIEERASKPCGRRHMCDTERGHVDDFQASCYDFS